MKNLIAALVLATSFAALADDAAEAPRRPRPPPRSGREDREDREEGDAKAAPRRRAGTTEKAPEKK